MKKKTDAGAASDHADVRFPSVFVSIVCTGRLCGARVCFMYRGKFLKKDAAGASSRPSVLKPPASGIRVDYVKKTERPYLVQ